MKKKNRLYFDFASHIRVDNLSCEFKLKKVERVKIMSKLHINIKIRLIVLMFQRVGTTLIIPFMAIYFANRYGTTMAGVIIFLSVSGNILSSFYSGYYSDKYGRKKILVFSSLGRLGAFVLMFLANIPGQPIPILTILAFLLINICSGLSVPATQAMIIDVTSMDNRKIVYTLSYWINNTATALGTLLGAFLFKDHFFELLLVVVIFNLFIYLLIKYFLEETYSLKQKEPTIISPIHEFMTGYKEVIADTKFKKFVLAGLLTLGLELQLGNYISVHLEENFTTFNLTNRVQINGIEIYGIIQVENAILVIILAGLIAKLTTKYGYSNIKQLVVGLILYTLGFTLILLNNNFYFLIFVMGIISIGEIMYVPMKKTLLAELPDEHNRSKYMALNTINTRGAILLGALGLIIGGFLSPVVMSMFYLLAGTFSIFLFISIYKELRVHNELSTDSTKGV